MPRAICQPVEIIAGPQFRKAIEQFRKRYRSVDEVVVEALTDEIGPDPTCGWAIQGWHGRVRKVRIANKDANVGKSKGYRLIYDWNPKTRILCLLFLYTHAQMEDIASAEIKRARQALEID